MKDKNGNYSGRELTVFISFVILVISWCVQLFLNKVVEEFIFITFAGIVVSGLGFKTFSNENKHKDSE